MILKSFGIQIENEQSLVGCGQKCAYGGVKNKRTLIASWIPIIFEKEQLSKFFCDTIKVEWVMHNAVTNFYSWCIYFIFSFIKCASQNYYTWDYPQTVTFEQWN